MSTRANDRGNRPGLILYSLLYVWISAECRGVRRSDLQMANTADRVRKAARRRREIPDGINAGTRITDIWFEDDRYLFDIIGDCVRTSGASRTVATRDVGQFGNT
jgi:hypothetical protein